MARQYVSPEDKNIFLIMTMLLSQIIITSHQRYILSANGSYDPSINKALPATSGLVLPDLN